MTATTLARLNRLVTRAILAAERTRPGAEAERAAYVRVSELEEQIGDILPANSLEGAIARRGAVQAAVRAGDRPRARGLFDHYMREGMPPDLATALEEIVEGPRRATSPKADREARLGRRAMLDAIDAFQPGPPKDPRYVGASCPECGRSDGGHNSRCPERRDAGKPL